MTGDLELLVKQVTDQFLQHLVYLGPIRAEPRAIFGFPTSPESTDIGLRGEHAVAVLEHHKDLRVQYPVPTALDEQIGETKDGTLLQAITEWLVHMRLVKDIKPRDLGKLGYELTLHSPGIGMDLDLTNVGVGVSQVLPSLVMALIAPRGSTLLVEQPELHLHPKVQSILGDFYLGLAQMGTQCIVETHSEYLVQRVVLRIVQAEGASLEEQARIYFVEMQRGSSRFDAAKIDRFGRLTYPTDFFDHSPEEAQRILEAAMKKYTATQNRPG